MDKIIAILCYVIKDGKILLGYKKKGFGRGKWNGFGGKVNIDEDKKQAALRELLEESGLKAATIEYVGLIDFEFPQKLENNHQVYVFKCIDFIGEPQESDEMKPEWFGLDKIPYDQTWDDDKYWLPLLLAGKKFRASFIFDLQNKVADKNIELVVNLE